MYCHDKHWIRKMHISSIEKSFPVLYDLYRYNPGKRQPGHPTSLSLHSVRTIRVEVAARHRGLINTKYFKKRAQHLPARGSSRAP